MVTSELQRNRGNSQVRLSHVVKKLNSISLVPPPTKSVPSHSSSSVGASDQVGSTLQSANCHKATAAKPEASPAVTVAPEFLLPHKTTFRNL